MKRADRGGGDSAPVDVNLRPVPVEWLGGGPWRLPSGKALAEFALQAGFLAPLLLEGRPGFGSGLISGLRGRRNRGSQQRAAH
jgi:hypothetical protein